MFQIYFILNKHDHKAYYILTYVFTSSYNEYLKYILFRQIPVELKILYISAKYSKNVRNFPYVSDIFYRSFFLETIFFCFWKQLFVFWKQLFVFWKLALVFGNNLLFFGNNLLFFGNIGFFFGNKKLLFPKKKAFCFQKK